MTFDNLIALLQKNDFGYYRLTNSYGETVAGSHIGNAEDGDKVTKDALIKDLNESMDLLPPGYYKIELKRNNRDQDKNLVSYRFEYQTAQAGNQVPQQQANYVSLGEVDARVSQAVNVAIAEMERRHQLDKQIDELKRQLGEAKKQPEDSVAFSEVIRGISDMAKIIGTGVIAEHWPEALGVIDGIVNGNYYEEEKEGDKDRPKRRVVTKPAQKKTG